jgi:citrate lyase beta subunit
MRSGRAQGEMPLILIIETALGIVNLREIITASRRTSALIFGAEDYAGSIGAVRSQEGSEVFYARSKVVAYAKAYGLQAIDIVYADFRDAAGFVRDAEMGLRMGYTGKQLIHPNQVPLIHAVYEPSADEVAEAQRIVDAHNAHQDGGTGAFALDGKMVDMPVVRQAELVLERACAAEK